MRYSKAWLIRTEQVGFRRRNGWDRWSGDRSQLRGITQRGGNEADRNPQGRSMKEIESESKPRLNKTRGLR